VARTIERAVTGQISTAQFTTHIIDRDLEPSGQKIFSVPAHRFTPTHVQWVWVSPFRRTRHDHDTRRKACSFPTCPLKATRRQLTGMRAMIHYCLNPEDDSTLRFALRS
jgi:hypothetical protein